MISAGIVAEYNPFHNGHAYHLEQTKKLTGADCIIAVMSGNFLQRGEPAIVSKFSRTKMALSAGIDIVIELPYAFATQNADYFAFGAVSILDSLGCDYICFGSESGSIESLKHTLHILEKEKKTFNHMVKDFMKTGMSYPKATSKALEELNPPEGIADLSKPNNILAFSYMKAIEDIHSTMTPIAVKRINSYHDKELSPSKISSATGIRETLFKYGDNAMIKDHMPAASFEEIVRFRKQYHSYIRWQNFWPYLQYRLIHSSLEEIRQIYEIEEGLEYRMKETALIAGNFHDFMTKIKTKRYTWTRLQRACTHVLTNTTKEEMLKRIKMPEYIRILGLSMTGRDYLRQNKNKTALPVISKLSSVKNDTIDLDVKAGRVYSFGFCEKARNQLLKVEYGQPPLLYEKI